MKRTFVVLAVCLLACSGWVALSAQNSPTNGLPGIAYLTTVTDATTGAFSSRSVVTLHADHSMTAIDSGQGGPGVQFSSQMGAWHTSPNAGVVGRTLDFSFPNAGIARVDYNFTTVNKDQEKVSATITRWVFCIKVGTKGSGGTVVGTLNFTV